MRAYSIALFFVIFGAVVGMINDMSIYDRVLPEHNVGLSDAEVQEITDGATNDGISVISGLSTATRLGAILLSGIITAITIVPLLTSYGIPMEIAIAIQAPIYFIYAAGIVQFFSGRSTSQID